MKTFQLKGLLTGESWLCPAFVTVDVDGKITAIGTEAPQNANIEKLDTYGLPGFQNAHSHAFQYAMAGLAERHAVGQVADDFWSWREAMYKLALSISPDDLEAIATLLYAEMLRHGYTHVAEFHYVHHAPDGKPYANLSEMGERLISAAKTAGIGITLVPIFYQKGGFGKPATEGQRRFLSADETAYYALLEASQQSAKQYDGANVAVGIHSMRGVDPEVIKRVAESGPQDLPFHIHIAEQLKEIEDSRNYLGKRPVEWLLDNVSVNARFHLVHATHLLDDETKGIADSGAHVVICPSTEGNLGDGLFPLQKFQNYGGKWSIGTDSHVGLNPLEELRILDYGQRLTTHQRNIYQSNTIGDSGAYAIQQATLSGRKAMGEMSETYFEIGAYFNAALINANHPLIATTSAENLLSTMVYAADSTMQFGTISRGRLVVKNGEHHLTEQINANFIQRINALKNR